LTDAVEKVGGKSRMHNNRIDEPAIRLSVARTAGFLNQNCVGARSKCFVNSIGTKQTSKKLGSAARRTRDFALAVSASHFPISVSERGRTRDLFVID
jgi:hypothetical protein